MSKQITMKFNKGGKTKFDATVDEIVNNYNRAGIQISREMVIDSYKRTEEQHGIVQAESALAHEVKKSKTKLIDEDKEYLRTLSREYFKKNGNVPSSLSYFKSGIKSGEFNVSDLPSFDASRKFDEGGKIVSIVKSPGKRIGVTRTGKPIYSNFDHPAHHDFTIEDHDDASDLTHDDNEKHFQKALELDKQERITERQAMIAAIRAEIAQNPDSRADLERTIAYHQGEISKLEGTYKYTPGQFSAGGKLSPDVEALIDEWRELDGNKLPRSYYYGKVDEIIDFHGESQVKTQLQREIKKAKSAMDPKNWYSKGGIADAALDTILKKYGWSGELNDKKEIELFNRKDIHVVTVKLKGSKYQMFDASGNKLMSGNGMLYASIEKLMTQYYYATELKEKGGTASGRFVREPYIKTTAKQFGWLTSKDMGELWLINRQRQKKVKVVQDGSAYQLLDENGKELAKGDGDVQAAIEKVLGGKFMESKETLQPWQGAFGPRPEIEALGEKLAKQLKPGKHYRILIDGKPYAFKGYFDEDDEKDSIEKYAFKKVVFYEGEFIAVEFERGSATTSIQAGKLEGAKFVEVKADGGTVSDDYWPDNKVWYNAATDPSKLSDEELEWFYNRKNLPIDTSAHKILQEMMRRRRDINKNSKHFNRNANPLAGTRVSVWTDKGDVKGTIQSGSEKYGYTIKLDTGKTIDGVDHFEKIKE